MRTGLNKSEVMMVLQELNEAILYFGQVHAVRGRIVLPGYSGRYRCIYTTYPEVQRLVWPEPW